MLFVVTVRETAIIERHLDALASQLITQATASAAIREGIVMTQGAAPYRRLDCDGRALAYVKTRLRKRAVRVDVSALWISPQSRSTPMRSSLGAAFLVRNEREVGEVVHFLLNVVERTRALENARSERR
jgi:hypothetical protein